MIVEGTEVNTIFAVVELKTEHVTTAMPTEAVHEGEAEICIQAGIVRSKQSPEAWGIKNVTEIEYIESALTLLICGEMAKAVDAEAEAIVTVNPEFMKLIIPNGP